jgi:PTH1 family peptidyl-tRNA hydrolase
MKLIVGLGNPGAKYETTRHNIGFLAIDYLVDSFKAKGPLTKHQAEYWQCTIEGEPALLIKPQTFMNLSGEAVSCLLKKEGRSVERMIVISDDLALPFGKIRIRPKGSHGGQNGLRNIIDRLGTSDFIRLRIGIQPEHPISNAKNFVLESFAKSEADEIDKLLKISADAVRTTVRDGAERAMAEFN